MELAKITSKGQITLPIAIRRKLNLHDGGKIAFVEENGKYFIANPTMIAFRNIQEAMRGEAERLGLNDVDDVVKMIKEMRGEKREKRKEDE